MTADASPSDLQSLVARLRELHEGLDEKLRLTNTHAEWEQIHFEYRIVLHNALPTLLAALDGMRAENEALREELLSQWESNHFEHCGRLPCCASYGCQWPKPAALAGPAQEGEP